MSSSTFAERCLACGGREYGYDPLLPYGVEPTYQAALALGRRRRYSPAAVRVSGSRREQSVRHQAFGRGGSFCAKQVFVARYSLRRLRSHVSLSAAWYKADNVQRFSDEGETIMARFVQMPIAGGQQGQFVIVNIDLVRYIRSVKTGQATVYFDDEQSLTVAMDAQQIAEAANGA